MTEVVYIPLLSAFLNLIVGIYIYFQNHKDPINKTFSSVVLLITVFNICEFLTRISISPEIALLWARIGYIVIGLGPCLLLHFSLIFPKKLKIKKSNFKAKPILIIIYITGIVLYLLFISQLSLSNVQNTTWGFRVPIPLTIIYIYIWFLILSGSSIIILIYKYFKQNPNNVEKKQINLVWLGAFIVVLTSLATNILPNYFKISLYPMTSTFTSIFIICIAYSIIKYKFLALSATSIAENILDTMSDLVVVVNNENKIVNVNKSTLKILQYKDEDILNQSLNKIIEIENHKNKSEKNSFENFFKFIEKKGRFEKKETNFINSMGKTIPMNISASVIFDKYTDLTGVIIVARDLSEINKLINDLEDNKNKLEERVKERTNDLESVNIELLKEIKERKKAEVSLREERDKAQKYLDIAGVIIVALNLKGEVFLINKKGCNVLGYKEEEIIGKNWFDMFIPDKNKDAVHNTFKNLISNDEKIKEYYENLIKTKKGERRLIAWHNTILRDKNNKIIGTLSSGEDITEKKKSEIKIIKSLKEKEILLKEIHHRVKNNLQVINSLLDLQKDTLKERKIVDILQESQNRVKSMALIHEQLYLSEDLAKIDFNEYLQNLIFTLFHSYGINSNNISFQISAKDIFFNIDKAIPCGLIVNELVSNSLKHAFPDNKKGKIEINISQKKEKITIIVMDNGVGLPGNIDIKNTNSLGLQLVNMLTLQLNGTLDLNCDNGTKFTINVPKKKEKS